jgi:hypothetical protein
VEALCGEGKAAIQIGFGLLVKANGNIVYRKLTRPEIALLENNPGLLHDLPTLLQQLQNANDPEAARRDVPAQQIPPVESRAGEGPGASFNGTTGTQEGSGDVQFDYREPAPADTPGHSRIRSPLALLRHFFWRRSNDQKAETN